MSTHPTSAGTADLATLLVNTGSPTIPMTWSRSSSAAPAPPMSSATRSAVRLRSLAAGVKQASFFDQEDLARIQIAQSAEVMLGINQPLHAAVRDEQITEER